MGVYAVKKINEGDEISELIQANEPKEDEIALLLDSSKVTGGNAHEFLHYLKENHSNVKVYGNADGVSYLQLNSIILSLGTLFATTIALPIVLNLVSNYIQNKIDRNGTRDMELRVSIVKQDQDGSLEKIDISGKVDDILKVIDKLS